MNFRKLTTTQQHLSIRSVPWSCVFPELIQRKRSALQIELHIKIDWKYLCLFLASLPPPPLSLLLSSCAKWFIWGSKFLFLFPFYHPAASNFISESISRFREHNSQQQQEEEMKSLKNVFSYFDIFSHLFQVGESFSHEDLLQTKFDCSFRTEKDPVQKLESFWKQYLKHKVSSTISFWCCYDEMST